MLQRGVSGIGSVELAAQRNEAAGGGQPLQRRQAPPSLPLPLLDQRKVAGF